jgi:aryl-alcohol dehydrogenase-like predicted oxidoreductase
MQYRHLGRSGLRVSAIGLGTNQFGGKVSAKGAAEIIHATLDQGLNFIDTADVYTGGRSEEAIGSALTGRRSQALIATKVFNATSEAPNDRGASRQHILDGVDASLRRLQTDYIDLYQIHRWDEETPIEETLRALDDLVQMGYIGASNFSAWQLAHANATAELRHLNTFVSIQPHYHMLHRAVEAEMLPACQYLGIGVLPYFPLAGGFLTGKYERGKPAPQGSRGADSSYVQQYMTEGNYTIIEQLTKVGEARGHSLNELAHAWLLAKPQVGSVISGATNVEQALANIKAGEWELTAEEIAEIDEVLGG